MSTGSSTTFFFTESFKCIKVKITKKKEGGRGGLGNTINRLRKKIVKILALWLVDYS